MPNEMRGLFKNGGKPPPEYHVWSGMKQRCHSKKYHAYRYYGAKGVKVCLRWRRSFSAFLADMGPRPDGASIDRIDPAGNYEPGNCRWSDLETQYRNKRNAIFLHGRQTTASELARFLGVSPQCVTAKLRRGLTPEQVVECTGNLVN